MWPWEDFVLLFCSVNVGKNSVVLLDNKWDDAYKNNWHLLGDQ